MVSFPEILDDHPKWEESVVAYDNRTLSRRGPVKMAGYWPSFALYCSSICFAVNFVLVHEKRTSALGQYSAILTSRVGKNSFIQ